MLMPEPNLLWRNEAELVHAITDRLRYDALHGSPQHPLGRSLLQFVVIGQSDNKLHQPVIEKRDP